MKKSIIISIVLIAIFIFGWNVLAMPPTSGLVGYWSLNEGSGLTAVDSSGKGNIGALINGPTWVSGKSMQAVLFDGNNDYVNVPHNDSLDPGSSLWSVSAWVKTSANNGTILRKGDNDPDEYQLNIVNGKAQFNINSGGDTVLATAKSLSFVNNGVWHNIAGVRTGTKSVAIYVDGLQEGTATYTGSGTSIDTSGPLTIGAQSGGSSALLATIDEVRIYNRALSGTEIQDIYNSNATTSPSDTTPPVISNGSPTGSLPAGMTSTVISVLTNENSICKYSTISGITYASMGNTFSTTGELSHSSTINGLSNGASYTYYIKCQDSFNNANTFDYSIMFSVSTTVSSDNTAPVVSLTAPANGATVSGVAVAVLASATDNVGIMGVQFKLDGINFGGEDTISPYALSWNTISTTNGTHSLSAVARDAAGNITISLPISITVYNNQIIGCSLSYPSQIIDILNWKETLPTGSSGSPTEIKQPALATYSNDPYFRLNSTCNGIQFRAPVNGVTTSGSSYPRSELREMTNNGTSNASWATNSGVHAMFIDQAITAVPTTKKHIVAGQIHDASDDVIVIRLEYPKLFVDINGTEGPTLDANYVLGKRFTIKFEASNGQVKIYYNGNINPAYTLNKSGSGMYFKAGAYTQSNCTKELSTNCNINNYGEVNIYNLWVQHNTSSLDTSAPSVPVGLTAIAVSSSQINLSWSPSTDSVGVSGYKIYRNGVQIRSITSGNSYSDLGLSPFTTYSYTVSAYDVAGNVSAQSSTQSATTQSLSVAKVTLSGNALVTITLTPQPSDAKVYYTTNGTDPTESSTLYSSPFTVNTSTQVKARAYKDGYSASSVIYVFNSTASPLNVPLNTGIALGDRIGTTNYLNVRVSSSLTASTLGTQPVNTLGTILDGPIIANGYTWWKIDYDTGPDGWSVENWIVRK